MKKLLLIFTFLLWLPFAHANEAEFNRANEAYDSGDYQTAFTIYKTLAEQGHAEAQFNLGIMYDQGEGVPKNYAEAFKWYHKVAEQGHAKAQALLGLMYAIGEGITKNYIKAYMWVSIAKVNGYEEAQDVIQNLEKKMDSEKINKAQELAAQCWESNYQNCSE